jgi:uncharacterized membrane protein
MRQAMIVYFVFIFVLICYALATKKWNILVSSFIIGGMTVIANEINWVIIFMNILLLLYFVICIFEVPTRKEIKRADKQHSQPSQTH